jgi:hypothetical protein
MEKCKTSGHFIKIARTLDKVNYKKGKYLKNGSCLNHICLLFINLQLVQKTTVVGCAAYTRLFYIRSIGEEQNMHLKLRK